MLQQLQWCRGSRVGVCSRFARAAAAQQCSTGVAPRTPHSAAAVQGCTHSIGRPPLHLRCRAGVSTTQVQAATPRQANQQQRRAGGAGAAAAAAAGGDTWLLVGLGNPGPRYEKTRHNVGFMVVDSIARGAGIDMRKLEKSAAVGRGQLHGRKVVLAKPVTFMNNSGEAVGALARFYKIPPQQVLVISDELDLPHASVRLKMRGGHGGHNGLRSIIQHLGGTQDFPRLKIGIGRPQGQMDVASYVLQEFKRSEMDEMERAIAECRDIIDSCLALGLEKALSGSRL